MYMYIYTWAGSKDDQRVAAENQDMRERLPNGIHMLAYTYIHARIHIYKDICDICIPYISFYLVDRRLI